MSRPTRPGPDLRLIGSVVVVLALITVFTVYVVTSGDDDDDPAEVSSGETAAPEYGATVAIGEALGPLPDVGPDPAIGQMAPLLRSERFDSDITVDPAALDEPVLLAFLAHWCGFCQAELPELVELQDAGALDGVRTVAVLIATDPTRPNYPPSSWLDTEGWNGERLFDDTNGTAATAYGVSTFPFLVLVDADGLVHARLGGQQAPGVIAAAVAELAA